MYAIEEKWLRKLKQIKEEKEWKRIIKLEIVKR